jgi:histidinol-phosphatase (PHP family)
MVDYHIHTLFSHDCQASMAEMCRAALAQGLEEIGFSEHFNLHPMDEGREFFRAEAWWKALESCRETFGPALTIRAGLEISEPHRYTSQVARILERFPWDYILGALHWVDDQLIFRRDFYHQGEARCYQRYFGELLAMVRDGEFDILAHVDIIKRYGQEHFGRYEPQRWRDLIWPVLEKLAERSLSLEVNTITLRRPINQLCPHPQLLRWFRQLGGRHVTLGSDAHNPEEVAFGLDRGLKALKAAGFDAPSRFRGRRPIQPPPAHKSGPGTNL